MTFFLISVIPSNILGEMSKLLSPVCFPGFMHKKRAPAGTRTPDLRITNASLYRLSHGSNSSNIAYLAKLVKYGKTDSSDVILIMLLISCGHKPHII